MIFYFRASEINVKDDQEYENNKTDVRFSLDTFIFTIVAFCFTRSYRFLFEKIRYFSVLKNNHIFNFVTYLCRYIHILQEFYRKQA